MANNVEVKLNSSGIKQFLKDDIVPVLQERGNQLIGRLPDGYEMETYIGKNRANVTVRAVTDKAIRENNKSNTLIKSLGGL